MSNKTIMLVCNAGMSTSILVTKMQEYNKKVGKDYTVYAVSTSKVAEEVNSKHIDAILLGPQVRYMEDSIKEQAGDIPVQVIDMVDYGMMNAENVIKTAENVF